jgi:uncharacterized protein YbjT (DUF2867 family)
MCCRRFLGPADKPFLTVSVADIAEQVVALLRGPLWQGRRTIELSSFKASPAQVATALSAALGKPVKPVLVPHDQWPGILAGNGFSPAVVNAFVEMYDGINSGHVAPEFGRDVVRGTNGSECRGARLGARMI